MFPFWDPLEEVTTVSTPSNLLRQDMVHGIKVVPISLKLKGKIFG
jgi:hypothetical protein